MKADVAIIMGSDSDLPKMKGAMEALDLFGISYEVKVVSAHRTPDLMKRYSNNAEKNGFKVIIAGAGGAAHLPGMVASMTLLPVIGVPITATKLNGLDSLLSIAQMPKGVPVATMAIDNSYNAGLLSARILGIKKASLKTKLKTYQDGLKTKIKIANKKLSDIL